MTQRTRIAYRGEATVALTIRMEAIIMWARSGATPTVDPTSADGLRREGFYEATAPTTDAAKAFRDRAINAEEYHEEPMIRKDARVTEEVVLPKSAGQRTETIDDSVRHAEVEVEDQRNMQNQGLQAQRQPGQTKTRKK